MEKNLSGLDGFTLSDLKLGEGAIIEMGNEYFDDDSDEFCYTEDVDLNNEEMLSLLNMDDFKDEEDIDANNDSPFLFYSMGFEKLKSKMTPVTKDGKVLKLLKTKGVGECVPHDAQVTIQYVGYFEYRDEPFDSSFTRGGSETYKLGQGTLLPGLELGITTMQKHEEALFIVHPDYGFGSLGCPPRIPPDAEILFCVRLLNFLDNGSADTFENLSREEKKLFKNVAPGARALLQSAKEHFQKHKITQAIREYTKATIWLENADLENDEDEIEAKRLLSRAYSNLAVCYNKENKPRRACIACNSVPTPSAKTHFNHGRALTMLGEYVRALEKLQIAHRMQPKNEDIIKEIRMVNEKQRKYLEAEKCIWKNCLSVPREEKKSSFQDAAREFCMTFARDKSVLRQPLPEGLTPEEYKDIREQAVALGISVTEHERYGKKTSYLNKPNY